MSFSTYMPQSAAYPQQPMMQRPMMPPAPQPMRPMYAAPVPPPIKINGRAGADAFYMGPNEVAVLFDENDDIFFFKSTDGAGYPTVKPYRFEPLPEQGAAPVVAYATQEEVAALRAEISELKGALNNGKQPVRKAAAKADADE